MLKVSVRTIEFIGGEHDGERFRLRDPTEWIWVGPRQDGRLGCFRGPRSDRAPYRAVLSARPAEECDRDHVCYLYAGGAFTHCGGCGALHATRDGNGELITACHLCGHALRGVTSGDG